MRRRTTRAGLDLGWFDLCLKTKNVRRSALFYRKLGFRKIGGVLRDRWVIISNGEVRIGLFQGFIGTNLLNFRGGDIPAIARVLRRRGIRFLKEPVAGRGSVGATIADPDGNRIFLNTYDYERRMRIAGRRPGEPQAIRRRRR